ncbi:hypothetical protein AN639_02235 [Candidatus Epulonipiscium fishelsonii]|uniref:Uncharacterized protein n=1 Tax=Candidatus Epulonipiscium fishelsonii TaxID=77094 RepID=A0ACC8XH58_9FIRM|nr:hypothetical protein AN639_02235 [Epulopiscium sp. SCG-B05WGA-EpuloA1]ONI42991.1 hypothetical protein AN396_00070 [Epulopiscium sp. SCG-B11WGA-EpuloA1]
MFKKFFVKALLLGVVMTGLTGCSEGGDSDQMTVGFMNTNLSNEYQVTMLDGAKAKAEEMGIKLVEQDGQGDAAKQISQMEQLISQQVDAIVMAPYDKDACAPAVTKAKEAGIPLVIVDSTVNNIEEALTFVGADETIVGALAMDTLVEAIGGAGDIMMIRGPIGNSAEVGRSTGALDALANYPDVNLVIDEPADWDREKALKLMENKLHGDFDIVGVLAQNDEMAIGAQKAIEAAGKQDQIKVIGIDAIPDALTAVAEGKLLATIYSSPELKAATAVQVAVDAANGQELEREYYVDFVLITQENVADFQ